MKATGVFEDNLNSAKKICLNRGSSRSSKSFSLVQIAALWLITGYVGEAWAKDSNGYFSIVRKTLPALRASTYRDFKEVMIQEGWLYLVKENSTNLTFTYGNRTVEFFSIDDAMKVRGRKRKHLFIDEANELTEEDITQLLLRTTGRVFMAFNPSNPYHCIKTFYEDVRAHEVGDVEVIVSTYKNNPYLEPETIREIELLQIKDYDTWLIFGAGQYTQLRGIVFTNWRRGVVPDGAKLLGYGLDWGFSNDVTAVVAGYKLGDELFMQGIIYERGLTNKDIYDRLQAAGVDKYARIYADSSEPKSVEEIYRLGYRGIEGVGAKDINYRINLMKQYTLVSCTDYVSKELETYKYRTDRAGNIINEPVDFNNHAIDAAGYLFSKVLNKPAQYTIKRI